MGRKKLKKNIDKGLEDFTIREIEEMDVEESDKKPDMVNHPSHYQSGNGLEVISVIESFGLDYHLGNAVKYILRCGRKGNIEEDIKKSIWYLNRFLEQS